VWLTWQGTCLANIMEAASSFKPYELTTDFKVVFHSVLASLSLPKIEGSQGRAVHGAVAGLVSCPRC
jgi:hypothetical protein